MSAPAPAFTPAPALLPAQEAALALTDYSPAARAQYRQQAALNRDRWGLVLLPFPCLCCNAAPADESGHCSTACEQAFDRG
jgi:hypothetical protein